MEQSLKDEITRLVNLKMTTPYDVQSMTTIIRNNVDNTFTCCSNCVAQIKFAQRRLKEFYNTQVQQEEQINTYVEPQVKKGCSSCKKKK